MRLGGTARYLAEAATQADIAELVDWASDHDLACMVIGGGSNIVWRDEGYSGLLIVNKIPALEVVQEDDQTATVKIGAGENWDHAVAWAVDKNLSGIETLSLIPGTAGATPVQNVEAYGQAIGDTLIHVEAFDVEKKAPVLISKEDCQLSYRNSRFKVADHGRFIICSIVLHLRKSPMMPPFHRGLQTYLDKNNITDFSPASIRQAVIAIRSAKLPDPASVANNGSFFKNPIVPRAQSEDLAEKFPDILNYPSKNDQVKVSAQWLIEHAGFHAGYKDEATGMMLWPRHALVFVNEHAKSTADLLALKQKIVDAVRAKFGITLEQEPELLP